MTEILSNRLRELFSRIYENGNIDSIDDYFDESYCQTVNGGESTSREQLRNQLVKTKQDGEKISILEKQCIESGSSVGHVHDVLVKQPDGTIDKANVISVFTFTKTKPHKLLFCEVVYVMARIDKEWEEKYNNIYD